MNDRINVARPSLPSKEEYLDEISELWETRMLTNMGVKYDRFREDLKDYTGCSNVSLFVNGHSALECALEVLGLQGEVITTPYTFASTTHAIVRRGLKPVFADIRLDDFNIDPSLIEPLIGPETSAIVPVHVYGNLCDVDAIQEIADRHGLKVVYDAAHAFGVTYKGASAFSYGDVSMMSFDATKVMHSVEGGALAYRDASLESRIDQWKNFGLVSPTEVEYPGCNAKMNEFNASMGICCLRHVDAEIARRRQIDALYRELLDGVAGIRLTAPPVDAEPNGAYFVVLVEDEYPLSRDGLMQLLDENGIGARRYFCPMVTDFGCYRDAFDSSLTPLARYASQHVLALPQYKELADDDVRRICEIIRG